MSQDKSKYVIRVYYKDSYGTRYWYVKDPKQASLISTLTGKKTIDETDMRALTNLGFFINQTMEDELSFLNCDLTETDEPF